jgi:hypothetical protein
VVPEGVDDATLHSRGGEVRVQIKSKHDPRRTFRPAELAEYLIKSIETADVEELRAGTVAFVLLLERPADGIEATGFTSSLLEEPNAEALLSELLAETAKNKGIDSERVLALSHIVVAPNPADQIVDLVVERTGCVQAAGRLVADRLRLQVGAMADANYKAQAANPAALNANDVQGTVDDVLGITDPAALLAAVSAGLCEPVSFAPLENAAFYQGVDTAPGHVGAGLVLARPEIVAEVSSGLENKRAAIIAGPSGCGKSAAAWLTAYQSRHAVRWYRIKRLSQEQVHLLVSLLKAVEAGEDQPVGFVFDDLGRDLAQSWDELQRAVSDRPGVLLLGTVREEDLYLVPNVASTAFVRPLLDEVLASQLWVALNRDQDLHFANWREPFEQSRGLMLEYVHLLTSGERLQDTLFAQVRRRIREERDDELAILRAVVSATRLGGTVDQTRLRERLRIGSIAFDRALLRLVHEHALRVTSGGTLAGLHEVRSAALHEACCSLMPRPVPELVAELIDLLAPSSLASVLPRLSAEALVDDDTLLGMLASRTESFTARELAHVHYGLGLVMCERVADRWLPIVEQEGIDLALAEISLMIALSGHSIDAPLFNKLNAAVARRHELAAPDLRARLLERHGTSHLSPSLADYHELAAALAPIEFVVDPPRFDLLPEAPAEPIALDECLPILATVRAFGPDLARQAVERFGGTDALLTRIHEEIPWVLKPTLKHAEDGLVVSSDVRLVNQLPAHNPNDLIVEHCDRLLAAAPQADFAASTLLGWDGEPAGFGDFSLAQKRMPRSASPPAVTVAWNRAMMRAVQRRHAAATSTSRTNALASAIRELADMLADAAEAYCRGQPAKPDRDMMLKIRAWLNSFIQAPKTELGAGSALNAGEAKVNDDLQSFVTSITSLADELSSGIIDKPIFKRIDVAKLKEIALAARSSAEWRWIDDPPVGELVRLGAVLEDLHAVFGLAHGNEAAWRPLQLRAQRSSRHNRTLPRFAEEARAIHDRTAQTFAERLRETLSTFTPNVQVVTRPGDRESAFWPGSEFLALIEVDHLMHYLQLGDPFIEAARDVISDQPVGMVAVRNGRVVSMLAISAGKPVFPIPDFPERWGSHLPLPLLQERSSAILANILEVVFTLSAVMANADRDPNSEEAAFAQELGDQIRDRVAVLERLRDSESDVDIQYACSQVLELLQRLQRELMGDELGGGIARDAANMLRGEASEFNQSVIILRVALVEWDLAALAGGDSQSLA